MVPCELVSCNKNIDGKCSRIQTSIARNGLIGFVDIYKSPNHDNEWRSRDFIHSISPVDDGSVFRSARKWGFVGKIIWSHLAECDTYQGLTGDVEAAATRTQQRCVENEISKIQGAGI